MKKAIIYSVLAVLVLTGAGVAAFSHLQNSVAQDFGFQSVADISDSEAPVENKGFLARVIDIFTGRSSTESIHHAAPEVNSSSAPAVTKSGPSAPGDLHAAMNSRSSISKAAPAKAKRVAKKSGSKSESAVSGKPVVSVFKDGRKKKSSVNAVAKIKSVVNDLKQDHHIFASQAEDYALASVDGEFYLTSPDGSVYNFSASEKNMKLENSVGTACDFIAANEKFSLGKMTDEAYLLISSTGEEITLAFKPEEEAIVEDKPEDYIPEALVAMEEMATESTDTLLGMFKTQDSETALVITEDTQHTLIVSDGSQRTFTPSAESEVLVTSSGTECTLIAEGDGMALGNLSDDAYVLITATGEGNEASDYFEQTLFSIDPADLTGSGSAAGAADASSSLEQEIAAALGNSGSTSDDASAADAPVVDPNAPKMPLEFAMADSSAADSAAAAGSEFDGIPLWAMSMAQRREAKRLIYQ